MIEQHLIEPEILSLLQSVGDVNAVRLLISDPVKPLLGIKEEIKVIPKLLRDKLELESAIAIGQYWE